MGLGKIIPAKQLFQLTTDLHFNMNDNLQTDCIFLDFAKAFDRVAHGRIILTLSSLRLDSLTLSWLGNFLSHRRQFIFVNNLSSNLSPVTSGRPQGSVVCQLFLIYVNNLPINISSCMRSFADDCITYRLIRSANDHLAFQLDLHLMKKGCKT